MVKQSPYILQTQAHKRIGYRRLGMVFCCARTCFCTNPPPVVQQDSQRQKTGLDGGLRSHALHGSGAIQRPRCFLHPRQRRDFRTWGGHSTPVHQGWCFASRLSGRPCSRACALLAVAPAALPLRNLLPPPHRPQEPNTGVQQRAPTGPGILAIRNHHETGACSRQQLRFLSWGWTNAKGQGG